MKRRDLALEYFPGKKPVEAVRNLRRWINNCPKLKEELLAINPNFFGLPYLTLTEVRLIKYYLGNPKLMDRVKAPFTQAVKFTAIHVHPSQ